MGMTINAKRDGMKIIGSAPALALAAGAAYLLSQGTAGADVDSWPHSGNWPTNTTKSDYGSSGSYSDPINIVFFNYGNADTVKSRLPSSMSATWPLCNKGSKQWLFIDDSQHGAPYQDDEAWVWAEGGSQNTNPNDSDGAGYNFTRYGNCPNETNYRYHARLFGRAYQSTHTVPWAPALNQYSMMAAHYEHCHNHDPFSDNCGYVFGAIGEGHHVHSWQESRNRLYNDALGQTWLDASNSFSRQVGNQGYYQSVYHDTVYYLKGLATGGGGGK